jgi:hypothetical protein
MEVIVGWRARQGKDEALERRLSGVPPGFDPPVAEMRRSM